LEVGERQQRFFVKKTLMLSLWFYLEAKNLTIFFLVIFT